MARDMIAGVRRDRLEALRTREAARYAFSRPLSAAAVGGLWLFGRCADALDERLADAVSDAGGTGQGRAFDGY